MLSDFPCNECGLCCSNINGISELQDYDQGDGVCKYLKDNKCQIYENRPEVCRVNIMYQKHFSSTFTKEAFYIENLKICRELQSNFGIPTNKLIKLDYIDKKQE
ncbi:YkgJ family cysteine cluster protein [Paenibacillus cremeus]|uniref:YkgJ family cysteine cluster protein n=1 Tax=Paenibacillus cremeus TaxID=2163881 RepID=A0A559K8B5_9BACL|nr:YkgJ family cysteine cluster protein [Paenibacillus cremeus]